MRTYKLLFHQKSQQKQYSGEDLVLCPRDFPHLKENDVIEIYNPEENTPHLLLKITKGSLREEFPQKDAVSIDQSIGAVFMFKAFVDVVVQKVDPKLVELDSIELTFKDQYLGRSDMWRLKRSLGGSCVYVGKKLEFCSSAIRCQVHELWTFGEKVTCGLITESTKIVFRSLTSMVYLFIQMSSEMWEFDIYGDLYFEKAVNGFLAELFAKWKQNGSNHEVTIVLFSRIFYNASSPEQFPEVMKECILTDYKGRYYEDFYRVVIQNEKYEDWRNTLINLRHVFVDYHDYLINFHKRNHPNLKIPRGKISTAAQGNFLEVLNMSLNVFEKHYIDRSFDRTGQISVVITPGVGVFEVDRELTNVTMQRVIDNGVGSDLVCVGEQPLHAVPLLKFHNKATHTNNVDDYSMPHWINLSFYSTNKRVGYASYIPRIKLPTSSSTFHALHSSSKHYMYKSPSIFGITSLRIDDTVWPTSMFDYDSYDENVFKTSGGQTTTKKRAKHIKRRTNASESDFSKIFLRQNSEPEMHQSISSDLGSLHNTSFVSSSMIIPSTQPSSAITIPAHSKVKQNDLYSSSFGALNIELKPKFATNPNKSKWFSDDLAANKTNQILSPSNSSHGCSPKDKDNAKSLEIRRPSRSLINPFDPSHAVIKLTSNRRRWTHIFPRGPTGTLIQQHISSGCSRLDIVPEGESVTEPPVINGKKEALVKSPSLSKQFPKDEAHSGDKMVTRLWGATGEQEWTPAMMTGVDWKSVTIPACLPLTTDYFPDDRSLKVDYLVSADYSLLPDDVNADYSSQRAVYRRPLTTKEVYAELVSQRLAQGFQNVIRCKSEKPVVKTQLSSSIIRTNSSLQQEFEEEHFMSIGRIFHRISLSESTIKVTLYRPRHPYPSINIPYKYRFQAPNNHSYEVSCGDFSTEKLENYNWNYLDHYICTRGDKDFPVNESLKYWRFRILVLPTNPTALKKIMGDNVPCNVFLPFSLEEKKTLIQDFLKFIETCINRIRRPNNSVPKGASRGPSGSSQSSTGPTSGFRERVNSNQLSERPRMKSGSRINEKQRQDSGNGRLSPFEANFDPKSSVASPLLEPLLDSQMGHNLRNSDTSTDTTPVDFKLKADSTYTDVITAMRSQKTGFSFIKSSDLPLWTFVSYDAVTWLFNHMEEMKTERQAIDFFSGMLNEKLILHASKDPCHRFVNGFYLYYIVTNDAEEPLSLEGLLPQWDSATFHNDWMEVEVPVPDTSCPQQTDFASDSVDMACHRGCISILNSSTTFKDVYADVDVSKKSDRQEWGHVRYQSVYYPEEAYEITIQWIQATGAIVTDLVQGWLRKAQQCNLQLIPVPTDLFALSHSNNSDPLRGPISIHLNSQSLIENFAPLNEGFCEQEWMDRMLYFQHNVALQFGFLRIPKQSNSRRLEISELHYVHTTGNMFIMIQLSQPILQAGYYWSWNYMVSKKWKTNLTPVLADDPFMFKVLMDFKAFCDNEDGRLINAWNDIFDPSKNKSKDFTRSSSRSDVSA